MPIFEYIGIDTKGKKAAGTVDAENERAARAKLRKMGVFPTTLNSEGAEGKKAGLSLNVDVSKYMQSIKVKDLSIMTRQLSTLIEAHIPLVDALNALVEQIENPKLRAIMARAREKVTEGTKFSDALRGHPKVFGDLYVNMINAGESSGALDIVLKRLAEFTEGQAKLKSKVTSAMIYPIIMAIVGVSLTTFLLVKIVPDITNMLKDMGTALPLPTQILKSVSDALVGYWYLFIIVIPLIIFGIKKFLKTPKGKAWWDRKVLKLPLFGNLTRMVIVSRFSRTLSTLLSSGVPLLTAMDIVSNIITNTRMKEVIDQTRESVREGQSVAEPLKRSGEFPSIVTHMIAVGEKTGELEQMLERVATTYDTEVENAVTTLTTILEPMMILAMAVVVGFIVISVMLPMLDLAKV